jgi:hypothetical protein
MGGSSEFIFCEPESITIDFSLLHKDVLKCLGNNYFGLCVGNENPENLTKLTGKELKDYTCDCMRLLGYMSMNAYTQWEKFLVQVLKQNSSVPLIRFHFFDRCGCVPYYFEIDGETNLASISIGSEFHILCTDVKPYDIISRYSPELINMKMKRKILMHSKKQETESEISSHCIPFREQYYEYEFNRENYERYYMLMKFKTEYFSDKIQEYVDKIPSITENDARILLELFPYDLALNN